MATRPKPLTKPGAHGTLYRYAIEYLADPMASPDVWKCWAYSEEDALEKFSAGDECFDSVRYARLTDAPADRQTWHAI